METQTDQGWAVPRFYKIGYLEVVLSEVGQKASFERIRQALLRYNQRLGEDQMSPVIGSRLRDNYTFWSPTQEALSELMHLGFIVQAAGPSSREYVDLYRAMTYELTHNGRIVLQKLEGHDPKARASFLDALTVVLVKAHPGFANLVQAISDHPLCIPEYTVEGLNRFVATGTGSGALAEDAVFRVLKHWPDNLQRPEPSALAVKITESLNRRFPQSRAHRPSQKDLLDTIDDAVLSFIAKARNISLDPISFNVCMSWGAQLAIVEQSRYVEDWPGRTIWATFKIIDGTVYRRGFKEATSEIIAGLSEGFRAVAAVTPDARSSGYLPIYRVRAQAAFKARVNLKLVDIVMIKLLNGELIAPYNIQIALGRATPPPPSEPVFTFQGRRFFDMLIIEKENRK